MAVVVAGVGYMGAKLVEDLLAQEEQVIAIDNLFSTDRNAIDRFCLSPNFQFCLGDVTQPSVIEEAFSYKRDITTVYSLAAQASAHPDAADPRYTEETNLIGPRVLLDAMQRRGIKNLVFAGSFRVYGNNLPSVIGRNTPYGSFGDLSHLSKCYVEKLMEMYANLYDMRCVSLRFGVIYGVSPVVKLDPKFMTAPNKFCLQAVRRERIEVHPSGMSPMGVMHVADASLAMQSAATKKDITGYDFYDAVSELCSVSEIAGLVKEECESLGIDIEIRLSDINVNTFSECILENSTAKLGFPAKLSIRDGIKEMLQYFLRQTTQRLS